MNKTFATEYHYIESKSDRKDLVFINMALSISSLSKDENTKVGSIIVDKNGKVVSVGYNGAPGGIDDNKIPHSRDNKTLRLSNDYSSIGITKSTWETNKYPFMIHSEVNAILTCDDRSRLVGATLYCTHFPCTSCATVIATSGIKKVKIQNNIVKSLDESSLKNTLYVFELAGIELTIIE
jgi:dCMP deaminase